MVVTPDYQSCATAEHAFTTADERNSESRGNQLFANHRNVFSASVTSLETHYFNTVVIEVITYRGSAV